MIFIAVVIVIVVESWVLVTGLQLILMIMHCWFKSRDLRWTHIITVIRSIVDNNLTVSGWRVLGLLSGTEKSFMRITPNFCGTKCLFECRQRTTCVLFSTWNIGTVTHRIGTFCCTWLFAGFSFTAAVSGNYLLLTVSSTVGSSSSSWVYSCCCCCCCRHCCCCWWCCSCGCKCHSVCWWGR